MPPLPALMPLSSGFQIFPHVFTPSFQVLIRGALNPTCPAYYLFPQLLHFRDEAVHILEPAVHGRQTHIGNIIDLPQLVHDHSLI